MNNNFLDIRTEESVPRDQEEGQHSSYLSFNLEQVDDDNYSMLYDEFKRIMNSKQKSPSMSQAHRIQTEPGYIDSLDSRHHRNITTGEDLSSKREILQKRFQELAEQYERTLMNSTSSRYSEANGSSRLFSNRNHPDEHNSRKETRGKGGSKSTENGQHKGKAKTRQNEIEVNEFLGSRSFHRNEEHENSNRERDPNSQYRPEHEYEDYYVDNHDLEIIEAAAIFIQKNYRGYLTRKLLRDYFEKLCNEEEHSSQIEFDRNEFERHSYNQRNSPSQNKPHHQKGSRAIIVSQTQNQHLLLTNEHDIYRGEEEIEDYQDPDAHALLIRKLTEQAQIQQEVEPGKSKQKNKSKDARGGNEQTKHRALEKNFAEDENQLIEGDSQTGDSIEGQTHSLVDLIERQKEEMRTMAQRYRDEDFEKDPSKKPARGQKEEKLPIQKRSMSREDAELQRNSIQGTSKPKSVDPIVVYEGNKRLSQQSKGQDESSHLDSLKGKSDLDKLTEDISLNDDIEGELRNRFLEAHYDEAVEPIGTNTNIPTELLDDNKTSEPQQRQPAPNEKPTQSPSNDKQSSPNRNLISHFFEAKQQMEESSGVPHQHETKPKTSPISLKKDAKQWQTQPIPEYKELHFLQQGGSKGKTIQQADEDENFQDNYLEELARLERMQEHSDNFISDRIEVEEEQQKSQDESDQRIMVHYPDGGSDYNRMMGAVGNNGEKMIVISTIQSDCSNDHILEEGTNYQLQHYNSPQERVVSPIAEANELSPIEKGQRSPFSYEEGNRKRNYEKNLSRKQLLSTPSQNAENEESPSALRRSKAKSNPESIGDTQQAIETLFGSSGKKDSGQKFDFEHQHRRQKSDSDYIRDNVIEELRRLDRVSQEANRLGNEKFERELDQSLKEAPKQAGSQEEIESENRVDEQNNQEFLKTEESAGRIEEGMRQWLEGNLNPSETEHEEELKGPDSERLMPVYAENKEMIKNPQTTPNVKGTNNMLIQVIFNENKWLCYISMMAYRKWES